jgi:hypothetical protein
MSKMKAEKSQGGKMFGERFGRCAASRFKSGNRRREVR